MINKSAQKIKMEDFSKKMESDQSQVEVQQALVELVIGAMNDQLYRKGEESRTRDFNGHELQPIGYSVSKILTINERMSRTDETFEMYKLRVIAQCNPKRGRYNAFLQGDELGVGTPKVSVNYFKIPKPDNGTPHQ